jgi:succinate dehydrogenase/fumarate reductase flavoprotein subunit
MAPISTPPFYALPLWPEGPNTNGGPIRNETAHICDPDYNPIPRLYSSGELGSVYGQIYSGSNNGESFAFGRIAGNNAANEVPWTS